MRNQKTFFANVIFYFVIAIINLPVFTVAQTIEVSVNNNEAIITTTITEPFIGEETSFGFFYRLEGVLSTNEKKSYFWTDDIKGTKTISIYLPDGSYNITAYQVRKNGPIRTSSISTVTSNGTTTTGSDLDFSISMISNPSLFPGIQLPTGELLKLYNSWNIYYQGFTNDNIYNAPDHYTEPTSFLAPEEESPWVILSLVLNNGINNSIKMEYPEFLSYENGIYEDCKIVQCMSLVENNNQSGSNLLTITSSQTLNGQKIVHLAFKKNENYLPELREGDLANFTVYYNDTIVEDFSFVVRPKPHDPNKLEVDKKELCECGRDEYLTYRIDYQNDGSTTTQLVTVEIENTKNLDSTSLVQVNSHTSGLSAPITNKTKIGGAPTFEIQYGNPVELKGIKQVTPYKPVLHECQDFFYIKVKKEDCRPAKTLISPNVKIHFDGTNEWIFTNLEQTNIVKKINCKPCPPNRLCPDCPRKKTCRLFSIFRPRNRNKN